MEPIGAGIVLAGKYRLEALIGRGGMGSVWRAQHLGLAAPVAVKLLDVAFGASEDALARFHREAKSAAAIRSPHVVQILDHGVDASLGAPFIVMELMDGESLAHRLGVRGRLSPSETSTVIAHVARALTRAHEAGLVHRDLKPDNIFLVRNEEEEIGKVLDFGIAKVQSDALAGDSGTQTGAVMGTVFYMSPEQIAGSKQVDYRTDLWALGVIAYECLVGNRPFDGDTIGGITLRICVEPLPIPSHHAQVPTGFDSWFARAVNRAAAQRFVSAREAAEALRLLCTGNPAFVAPPIPVEPPAAGQRPARTATEFAASGKVATDAPVSSSSGAVVGAPVRNGWLRWLLAVGVVVGIAAFATLRSVSTGVGAASSAPIVGLGAAVPSAKPSASSLVALPNPSATPVAETTEKRPESSVSSGDTKSGVAKNPRTTKTSNVAKPATTSSPAKAAQIEPALTAGLAPSPKSNPTVKNPKSVFDDR